MKILVNAFVYLGEDAGSTHTVEIWRQCINSSVDSVRVMFPQPERRAYDQFRKVLDYSHIVFVPGTRRMSNVSLVRKFKFIFSSFIYDIFCVWHAIIFRPDIIYIRSRYLSIAPLFYIMLGKKFIFEVNGLAQYGATRFSKNYFVTMTLRLHVLVERYFFQKARALICVTERLVKTIKEEYNIIGDYFVVSNGVNTEHFKPATRRDVGGDSKITFGFVGHCAPWQGMGAMIHALAEVWDENMSLVIVGDGPARSAWEVQAKKFLTGKKYSFVGSVAYENVPTYIQSFDVCLAPFTMLRNESIGLSPLKLYEYLACGKPVLTTNIPGVREVVTNINAGVVAENDSIDELTSAVKTMLQRRSEWNAMGSRGRTLVELEYSWKRAAEKTMKIVQGYQG